MNKEDFLESDSKSTIVERGVFVCSEAVKYMVSGNSNKTFVALPKVLYTISDYIDIENIMGTLGWVNHADFSDYLNNKYHIFRFQI